VFWMTSMPMFARIPLTRKTEADDIATHDEFTRTQRMRVLGIGR
jgi:hypothetical protein